MKIIDFRSRPPFGKFLTEGNFYQSDSMVAFHAAYGSYPPKAVFSKSIDDYFQEMVENNIELCVTTTRKAWNFDGSVLVDLIQAYPDRFRGSVGVSPLNTKGQLDLDACFEEIDNYVNHNILSFVSLDPALDTFPWYFDDQKFYPLYEKLQNDDITVCLSWGGIWIPDMSYYYPAVIDRVARDFPKLKIVLCHGGYPWTKETCYAAFSRGNLYLCPDLYMWHAPGSQDYVTAANCRLKDRIVFASAYPALGMKDAVETFLNAGFEPDVLEKVMYSNAASLLKLE